MSVNKDVIDVNASNFTAQASSILDFKLPNERKDARLSRHERNIANNESTKQMLGKRILQDGN